MANKPSAVLEKLSEQYGPKLIEFVFCCIAASRDGLTMQELEDLCSLSDDVLNEQYERDNVVPQIRRIPQKTWSSLRDALTAHLSSTYEPVPEVKAFTDEDLAMFVRTEYLSDLERFVKVHTILGQYFSGKWSGDTPKPFETSEKLQTQFSLPEKSEAVRHVAAQPLIFPPESERPAVVIEGTRYNVRKLREQAYHLIAACQWSDVVDACFSNYEHLRMRIVTTSVDELLDDFDALPERVSSPLAPIFNAIKDAKAIIAADPFQLASQVAARLLPSPQSSSTNITGYLSVLLEGARRRGCLRDAALLPKHACIPSSTDASLRDMQAHDFAVHGIGAAMHEEVYVTASDDKRTRVWRLGNATPLHDKQVLADWGRCGAVSPTGEFCVVGGYDTKIHGVSIATGQTVFSLEGHTAYVTALTVFSDGKLLVSASEDKLGIVWDLVRRVELTRLIGHDAGLTGVAVCDARRIVTSSKDATLRVWDIDTGACTNTLYGHKGAITTVATTARASHIISGGEDGAVRVWAMPGRSTGDIKETETVFTDHSGPVTSVAHTHTGSGLILSASRDKTVRLWNFIKKTPVCVFTCTSAVLCVTVAANSTVALFGTESGIVGTLELHRTVESIRNRATFLPDSGDDSASEDGAEKEETEGAKRPGGSGTGVTDGAKESGGGNDMETDKSTAPTAAAASSKVRSLTKSVSAASDDAYGFPKSNRRSVADGDQESPTSTPTSPTRKHRNKRTKSRPQSVEASISLSQLQQMAKDDSDIKKGSYSDLTDAGRQALARQSSVEQVMDGSRESLLSTRSEGPTKAKSPLARSLEEPGGFTASVEEGDASHDDNAEGGAGDGNGDGSTFEPKTLSRPREFLSSRKFEALEATNMSIEAKQAAFEALVLGENPEVLNMEMEQRQRRPSAPIERLQFEETQEKKGCCTLL